MNTEFLIPIVIFFGMYHIFKLLSDHLLKRKLIKAGQYEKAGILEPAKNAERNKYPSLKWGLVALTTGAGFIIIELLGLFNQDMVSGRNTVLPFGILLVSVALGFLIYFFLMNKKNEE